MSSILRNIQLLLKVFKRKVWAFDFPRHAYACNAYMHVSEEVAFTETMLNELRRLRRYDLDVDLDPDFDRDNDDVVGDFSGYDIDPHSAVDLLDDLDPHRS